VDMAWARGRLIRQWIGKLHVVSTNSIDLKAVIGNLST